MRIGYLGDQHEPVQHCVSKWQNLTAPAFGLRTWTLQNLITIGVSIQNV
jgi:hypothetical protein